MVIRVETKLKGHDYLTLENYYYVDKFCNRMKFGCDKTLLKYMKNCISSTMKLSCPLIHVICDYVLVF